MNKADRRAAEAAEMKFLRHVAGYTREGQTHKVNNRQNLNMFNPTTTKGNSTNMFYV
jgi:hypothetical protein